jgi:hypothetical protein
MSDSSRYRSGLVSAVADGPGGARRLATFVAIIRGDRGVEAARAIMKVIKSGFESPTKRLGERMSFARLCRAHSNIAALRSLVDAGAPHLYEMEAPKTRADWLQELCTWNHEAQGAMANLYGIALYPLSSSSRAFLELAYEGDPAHNWVTGTLHLELLWNALSEPGATIDQAATLARQIKPEYPKLPADAHERLAAALDCIEFLREAKAPCLQKPMDASPFALAYGLGRQKDVVKPVMQAYMEAGILDIHRTLDPELPDVGGASALEAAVWARNAGAAVALVELGADIDFQVPASLDETTAQVMAQVTQAFMLRRIQEKAAPVAGPPASAGRRLGL